MMSRMILAPALLSALVLCLAGCDRPAELVELEITASGHRTTNREETIFSYSFNRDLELVSLTVTFPDSDPQEAPGAAGPKFAGETYTQRWHRMGSLMPTGDHDLRFRGTFKGTAFDTSLVVVID